MELTSSDLAAEDPENNFNLHAFNTLNKVAPPPETRTVRQSRKQAPDANDLLTQARRIKQFSMQLVDPAVCQAKQSQRVSEAVRPRGAVIVLDDETLEQEIQGEVDQLISRIKSCSTLGMTSEHALLDQALEEEEQAALMPGSRSLVARLAATMQVRSEGGGTYAGSTGSTYGLRSSTTGAIKLLSVDGSSPTHPTNLAARPSGLASTFVSFNQDNAQDTQAATSPLLSSPCLSQRGSFHGALPQSIPGEPTSGPAAQSQQAGRSSGTMPAIHNSSCGSSAPNLDNLCSPLSVSGYSHSGGLRGAGQLSPLAMHLSSGAVTGRADPCSTNTSIPKLPAIHCSAPGNSSGIGAKRALPALTVDTGSGEGGGHRPHGFVARSHSHHTLAADNHAALSPSSNHSGGRSGEWETVGPPSTSSTGDGACAGQWQDGRGVRREKSFSEMLAILRGKHCEAGGGAPQHFSDSGVGSSSCSVGVAVRHATGAHAASRTNRLVGATGTAVSTGSGRHGGSRVGNLAAGVERSGGSFGRLSSGTDTEQPGSSQGARLSGLGAVFAEGNFQVVQPTPGGRPAAGNGGVGSTGSGRSTGNRSVPGRLTRG